MSDKVIELRPRRAPVYVRVEASLYLHTVSGVYYVRKSFKHLKIPDLFESLRTEKVTVARREIQRKIEAHRAKYLGGRTVTDDGRTGKTIATVIEELLITHTPKLRIKTREKHALYFGELAREWGYLEISRLTLLMWERWLIEFKKRKKRRTFDDYAIAMNMLLNYAARQRYLSHTLTLPLSDPKSKAGRLFTDPELSALWAVMNEDLRDQFVLAFECFMRLRESLSLTWERFDLTTGKLILRAEDVKTGSKTGKGRTFFVSPNALSRLQARAANRSEESPYVFPGPGTPGLPRLKNDHAWGEAKRKAGIRGRARWHDIRHTSLTKALLEQELNAAQVSEYAGVSLRTIQRVYLHSNEELTKGVAGALSIARISREQKA